MREILKSKDKYYLEQFFKIFLIVLEKIILAEQNKEILLEIHQSVKFYIEKNPKVIKKNFKFIFPLLYLSMNDNIKEVQTIAKSNLDILLKSDLKMAKALHMFINNFF